MPMALFMSCHSSYVSPPYTGGRGKQKVKWSPPLNEIIISTAANGPVYELPLILCLTSIHWRERERKDQVIPTPQWDHQLHSCQWPCLWAATYLMSHLHTLEGEGNKKSSDPLPSMRSSSPQLPMALFMSCHSSYVSPPYTGGRGKEKIKWSPPLNEIISFTAANGPVYELPLILCLTSIHWRERERKDQVIPTPQWDHQLHSCQWPCLWAATHLMSHLHTLEGEGNKRSSDPSPQWDHHLHSCQWPCLWAATHLMSHLHTLEGEGNKRSSDPSPQWDHHLHSCQWPCLWAATHLMSHLHTLEGEGNKRSSDPLPSMRSSSSQLPMALFMSCHLSYVSPPYTGGRGKQKVKWSPPLNEIIIFTAANGPVYELPLILCLTSIHWRERETKGQVIPPLNEIIIFLLWDSTQVIMDYRCHISNQGCLSVERYLLTYQCRNTHCGDKMILWSSYLYNGISYTDKVTFLYWIRHLIDSTGYTEPM